MAYSDTDFDKDIETALRMQSGFQGPIVPEAPGEEPARYRSDPGYAARQAALAAPGQERRAVGVNMDDVLALDRFMYGQRVKQMEGGFGGREAAVDYALKAGQSDISRRETDRQARLKEDLAVNEQTAKTGKLQAESAKLMAEASGGGPIKDQWDLATRIAREDLTKQGIVNRVPTAREIDKAAGTMATTKALAGKQAERDLPSITPELRKTVSELNVQVSTLAKMQKDFEPIFTGQEAPISKVAKFLRLPENPNFIRFRIRAQAVYAPARTKLIGAAQTPNEQRNLSLLLPPDITKMSDQEAIASMQVLHEQTVQQIAAYRQSFKWDDDEQKGGTVAVNWGRNASGQLVKQ